MTAYDTLAIIGAIVVGALVGLVIAAILSWSLHQFGVAV